MNTSAKILAVIPARMGSTRLPGKPLSLIGKKTLVERVWDRAVACRSLNKIVVATDSTEIADVVRGFGGNVEMTSEACATGSERVAEVVRMSKESWDLVVNIQGDMPFLRSEIVDAVVSQTLAGDGRYDMGTAATPICDESEFLSPSNVKVVATTQGEALYFSRSPIPFSRDGEHLQFHFPAVQGRTVYGLKHFGLYVFRPRVLELYQRPELSPLERIEKLEQLRVMEAGYRIALSIIDPALTQGAIEVDTPEDLARANELTRGK